MQEFIAKYREKLHGVISGFDRLVFRGTLRAISYAAGMNAYLCRKQVWLGDFAEHVQAVSEHLKESSLTQARKLGRQVVYLASSQVDKDALARQICVREKISQGPVCVITCVEPCSSFEVYRNIPLGPNGGATGNKPGTGQGTVGVPEEIQGICTTNGTIVPSPLKSVEVLVFWLLTHNGLVGRKPGPSR